ncbi:galactose ABC transporter substrate-binding protein [Clostridium sp.]|uniref:galactose ABC transporter substrate-binding protein n=1 Tax=Clostridium sp. TaxID=1506 RepID=UPI0028473AB6|nr:galactose ABC transporter substrate-binding protein [Clostridium sp.]MDR3598145.1 galactose ABC transporter substrate-binding protein [Clostridium sp.]
MKKLKSIRNFIIVLVIISSMLTCCGAKNLSAISNIETRSPVKVGVLVYSDDAFSSLIAKSLEDIQKENENKVEFAIFNAKGNPAIESQILTTMFNNNYNLILANIAGEITPELIENSINNSKQKNIPMVLFNTTPAKLDLVKGYSKSLFVNDDSKQSGILQGKMIANAWNTDKSTMDKNSDNIMQYIMIKGESESVLTDERTKYSILTINESGIETEEIASVNANWDKELAKSIIEQLFLKYGNKIEVIIANNDAMAIGAVEALQQYGYNMGDKAKTIPIYGINGRPEAQELIKKGFMAGSIPQNPRAYADAIYTIGMNLVSGNNPLEGTNYKFDETGAIVRIQPE